MKRIQQIVPTLLIILLTSPIVWAQNLDANRMNRDIKIMENILGEMFKTYSGNSSNQAVFLSEFSGGSRNVRGTYLPGYGIIFNVQSNSGNVYISSQNQGTSNSFYYSYSTEESSDANLEVDEASVKDRISEFLKDYASTIGQLKPNENVMVIYGSNSRSSFPALVYTTSNGSKVERKEQKKLPVISGSITKKDLDDYRSGKINDSAFKSKVQTASTKDKEYLDLKVMGNIFETALRDQEEESFRLSGSVNYLMLDNFGAIFNLDASYRTASNIFGSGSITGITVNGAYVRNNSRSAPDADKIEKEEAEFLLKVNDAYASLKNSLKEYLVDYGRTISSVKPEQYILTTVNIRGRYKDIPERIDVQLKKSVLDQLDRGTISRERALEQVVITEY